MKRIIQQTKTERRIRNIYLIAFVLLLLSYLFTLYANRQLQKQSVRVDHTNKIIKTLDQMQGRIVDGETGIRGYVLTKNIQFLFPYYGAEEKTDSLYALLLHETKDNDVQQSRMLTLRKLIDRRFDMLRFHLKTFQDNRMKMTDSMMGMQIESKKLMDGIRENISLMQRHENRLLEERGERLQRTTVAITTITIVSLTLALSLLFFGLFTYMQVSRERKKVLAEIEEYQSRLNYRIQELDDANMELIKMRSLEKFAATGRIARTIAHEIRNPLTNINLASEQLKEEVTPENENSSFLFEMITRNSSRINQLISDLLNSTKFSELNYEKVAIDEFVDDTLKEAEDRITLNHITVVKKYKAGSRHISIDKTRMKIALLNIIINAIEAMEGRENSQLNIETKIDGKKCRIIISDNGQGMDMDSLSRIFEPYFTSKPKGNGLGLTNVQNIILNHSGEISVDSTRGKGTSFIIVLELLD